MDARVVAAIALAAAVQGCGGIVLDHVDVGADDGGRVEPIPTASVACPNPSINVAPDGPLHGTIEDWGDAIVLGFSASGVSFPAFDSRGRAEWSLASLSANGSAGSVFFVDSGETLAASAPSVSNISQITAEVRLDYSTNYTPLLLGGEFVVLHSVPDDVYMALRVNNVRAIEQTHLGCYARAVGSFSFYIQPNGTTDFSGFAGF
ncbi:MAG TPA: hypothetical protein VH062_07135 [Polyangiaceae bacterium]|jgi:hypothetical protein|nr:hypothetical protein [Polyangiaceae bacterium]